MRELGFFNAKEFQIKSLSRIIGGHSLIGIAPLGAGKTTSYILGVLMRLKNTQDEAPKVLILAEDEERVEAIVDRFLTISRNKNLHIMGLKATRSMEDEIDELVLGVDIVVATPSRARATYLKLGLNLNRIQTFIIDDAEPLIKQGMQTFVRELAQSCGHVQYLVFSTVENKRLHLMIDDFMPYAPVILVDEDTAQTLETHELFLYRVPNFDTKINLLNLLLSDRDTFDKVVIFANEQRTVRQIHEGLDAKAGEVGWLYTSTDEEITIFSRIGDFKQSPVCRILLVSNEDTGPLDLKGIPFIFHFDIPETSETFAQRVVKTNEEVIAITFATDKELPQLNVIEYTIGKKIPIIPLPEDLEIEP